MKMQRLTAALTAAAVAVVSSVAAFSSSAFAESAATTHSFDPGFTHTVEMREDMDQETDQFTLNTYADTDW